MQQNELEGVVKCAACGMSHTSSAAPELLVSDDVVNTGNNTPLCQVFKLSLSVPCAVQHVRYVLVLQAHCGDSH